MSLDEYVRKFLDDTNIDETDKEGIRLLWASHLKKGQDLARRGLFHEAIAEYAQEHTRPIKSRTDADIVQLSYCLKGRAYKELGELEHAIAALQKARELLKLYSVGSGPHEDLAEIFIGQGRYDEAIEMCQELPERTRGWRAEQLLSKAIALKQNRPE